jgi:hypothetical protein
MELNVNCFEVFLRHVLFVLLVSILCFLVFLRGWWSWGGCVPAAPSCLFCCKSLSLLVRSFSWHLSSLPLALFVM